MNNSFARLVDGMCATLRQEVLTRLEDDFARGQVFGVINLLNTFKARADWSSGFLLQQIAAQQTAFDGVRALLRGDEAGLPPLPQGPLPHTAPIAQLLARRDEANQSIAALLQWMDAAQVDAGTATRIEELLRAAMRAEIDIELKNSPRPLFAEMSSGKEN